MKSKGIWPLDNVSAGLSSDRTWYQSFTLVLRLIFATRFAIIVFKVFGYVFIQFNAILESNQKYDFLIMEL